MKVACTKQTPPPPHFWVKVLQAHMGDTTCNMTLCRCTVTPCRAGHPYTFPSSSSIFTLQTNMQSSITLKPYQLSRTLTNECLRYIHDRLPQQYHNLRMTPWITPPSCEVPQSACDDSLIVAGRISSWIADPWWSSSSWHWYQHPIHMETKRGPSDQSRACQLTDA